MSVGPRVLLSRGARFQLSRSALGLSTLRAPSNAGCVSLGARFRRLSMPVRGSCVPCSGALSDSQGSPPHGSASSVVSAQSAAARAGSSRFHRGERFRRVRGPEVLRAFRQLRGVLRALTFSALGALSGNRNGGGNAAGHTQNTLYFGLSVLSCTSDFDRKKR